MLKILGILAAVLLVVVAALLLWATMRPDAFQVTRSMTIKAAPEKIIALIDDFQHWADWSPYEKRDPAMTRTLSGAAAGKGAIYEWQGNSKVGQGRMEITDEVMPSTANPGKVAIKLDFIKPIEGHNIAEFTLVPAGDLTAVTWTMSGPSPYIAKVMGIFFSMDKMIGGDFETGLANLKTLAEQ